MTTTSVTTGADGSGRTVRGVRGIFSFGAGRYGEYGEFFPSGRAVRGVRGIFSFGAGRYGEFGEFILRGITHRHPKSKSFAHGPVSASIIRVLAHSIIRNGSTCIGLPDVLTWTVQNCTELKENTFVFHFHIQLFRTDFTWNCRNTCRLHQ